MRRSYQGIAINTSKNTHEVVFNLITVDKEAKIIDIPSGAGAFIKRLLDNGFRNAIAIDIVDMLAFDHKQFMVGDMNKTMPFEDASVDAIVCIDGIEHISRQFDFVTEVCRVLKRNGVFVVSTPNISSLRSRFKWFLTGHHHKCSTPLDEINPSPLHHIGMLSFPEMRYLLHSNGLQIETIATNRIKAVSWVYLLFVPLIYLFTATTYIRSGKKDGTTQQNRQILKAMFSKPILFGETMIVRAIKS
jgi:SAM-dependent methyltransferase